MARTPGRRLRGIVIGALGGAASVAPTQRPTDAVGPTGDPTIACPWEAEVLSDVGWCSRSGAGTLADLNGDGRLDIVTACDEDGVVMYHLNDGADRFDGERIVISNGNNAEGATDVASGDLDGDGRADLVVAAKGSERLVVMLNRVDGADTAYSGIADDADDRPLWLEVVLSRNLKGLHMTRVADLDGDGAPEVIYAAQGGGGKFGFFSGVTNDEATATDTRISSDVEVSWKKSNQQLFTQLESWKLGIRIPTRPDREFEG